MAEQRQEGGRESSNYQAGRDLVVQSGASIEEVRQISLDVFRENFLELRGVAEDVAKARAEAITNAFLEKLEQQGSADLANASDPDLQRAIFDAQREYACSGEEDLETALVDLLVDRAGRLDRSVQTIALNEAINAVPKLTAPQRRAIAVCFMARYTTWRGPLSLDAIYADHIKRNLVPLASDIPREVTAYQHIEYVRAGSLETGGVQLAKALQANLKPWFTRGIPPEQIPEELQAALSDERVFVPCIREDSNLQLRADFDALPDLAAQTGYSEEALRGVHSIGEMAPPEVKQEVLERVPELESLFAVWDDSQLCRLTLTTVGLTIGHGYWRRITGSSAHLSNWLKA